MEFQNINHHITKFLKFLNIGDVLVEDLMGDHDWDNDSFLPMEWMQANWKLLVQREILGENCYLPPFFGSVRLFNRDKPTTHNLVAKIKNDPESSYGLGSFLTQIDVGKYWYKPPYNIAHLYLLADQNKSSRDPYYFPIDKVDFFIVEYEESPTLI
jgi:hypothetical protein